MPKDPTYFQKVASQENGKKGGRPKRHRDVAPSVLKLYFDTKDERDNTKLILGVSAIIALFFLIIIFVLIWWIGKKLPNGNE
jgi:hypothetical protein